MAGSWKEYLGIPETLLLLKSSDQNEVEIWVECRQWPGRDWGIIGRDHSSVSKINWLRVEIFRFILH